MPILRYQCERCGKEFAKIIVDPEHAPKNCPVCESARITEMGPAFQTDPEQMKRALCMSCDSCEDEQSCGI
jgi:putative FmdB family regulatory protein